MASSGRIVKCAAILILSLIVMLGGVAARNLYGSKLHPKHTDFVSRGVLEAIRRIPITERLSRHSPSFDLHYYNNSSFDLHL
ncbi:hypothetical protein IHE45_15G107200 [Dioscorea alata]|uniref:Uncharacterized protein n=1 Tax=Dioscorea alata TaxID=55571 RepID=A0ACB7UNU1_DIOAL|nr:hypothetical protein IHE45_15G107200 [Dioscorea alata]